MKFANRIAALLLGITLSFAVFAGLETATYIHELVATNPVGATDPKSQGDDHVRMIKATLLNTFPNINGPITPTHTELNYVDGVTSAVQTQLNDKVSLTGTSQIISGTVGVSGRITLGSSHIINTDNIAGFNLRNSANSAQIVHISDGGVITAASFRSGAADGASFTPTAFNCINCGATPAKHFYSRTGNVVTVSGRTSLNITTGSGTSTSFQVSLPVASNFTAVDDLAGNGSVDDTGAETLRVQADTTNDRASVFFNATSTGLAAVFYTFQYEVK